MKRLIKGQKIRIDDHRRGISHVNFDDDTADIHLDKESKSGSYRIRIPLNTNRDVSVEVKGRRLQNVDVPDDICREVRAAFDNQDIRKEFVDWLVEELKNYHYSDPIREKDRNREINKAFGALRRISKHFGLDWNNKTVRGYIKENKSHRLRYIATITDGPYMFFLSIDKFQITIADIMMIGVRDRKTWVELPYNQIGERE